jgi:DNA-directed RNA polymerase subunit RPC12/RpoP
VRLFSWERGIKIGKLDQELVTRSKACPYCADSYIHRLAEREAVYPWRWRPIGYRCSKCGQVWIDAEVQVIDIE